MNRIKILLVFSVALAITLSTACDSFAQDSKFHKVAPEKCWAYSHWAAATAGIGDSDEWKATNHTEQLLAEPEIKAFSEDLIKRIGLLGPAMMGDQSPEKQKLVQSISPKLANIIFKRNGCFFLEDVKIKNRDQTIQPSALMYVDAGDDAVGLADEISQLMSHGASLTKVTLEGKEFNKFLLNEENKIELLVGVFDRNLLLGIGQQTVTDALKRLSGKETPSWMANFRLKKTKTLSNFSYFNVKEIRDTLAPLGDREVLLMIGMLGLGNVDSVETSAGRTEGESYSSFMIRIDGRPEGIFDLYSQKGLQLKSLQHIPDDSLFAFGFSLDPNRAFRMLNIATLQMDGGRNGMARAMAEMKEETGVDFKSEVIDSLGDTWTLHNGSGDGWFSGLTLMGTLKSPDKISGAINSLLKTVIIETESHYEAPKFKKRTIGSDEVFTMTMPNIPFPVQPSWCISGDRLIVGLFPQAVETALRPAATTPLIDQARLEEMFKVLSAKETDSKLIAFTYTDTKNQFPITYPYVQMMLSMSQAMTREMNLPPQSQAAVNELLGGIRLPAARTIHRHLGPTWMTVRQTDFGIEIETTQTIPSIDAGYIAPIAVGALLPAVQQVRGAARRTVSLNNLRQLALAAHNFESVNKGFPAAYSVDDKGKKLLSWRVHILPYLEQNDLYEQFNLREPWDSPTNKKLIEKMPEVFRSPVSSAEKGMTVYRSVNPKSGIFGPAKKPFSLIGSVGFGAITDGSSNTIMCLETNDTSAHEWTKPDEGIDPTDFDTKAIFGSYPGGTNCAMGDGSAQFVSDTIDKEMLRFLMERSDGNIVSIDDFSDSPRRNRRRSRYDAEQTPVNPLFKIDNGEVELTIDNLLSKTEKLELQKKRKLQLIRQIGLACLNYESAHRKFPSAFTTDKDGKGLLSWRVHILPFLDEMELFEKFKLNEPWDSEHNIALLDEMPEFYNMAEGQMGAGETTVMAMGGPGGVIPSPSKNGTGSHNEIGFANITDGSSNTLMLVNVPEELGVEWTKPAEFDPDDEAVKLILSKTFVAVLCDGSMHTFKKGLNFEFFNAMWTRDRGEIIDISAASMR